jgi:FAD/FMN-containing dehydrogenase
VRSGGHHYEGLSYRSARPEELYYAVAKNNPEVAFPAGICPTIGVGGHFSGGGIGMMVRKFGLSIDNVVDAKLVNVNGEVLDRAAMGES